MTLAGFLIECSIKDIRVYLEGGKLKVEASGGALREEEREYLKANKGNIIELFKKYSIQSNYSLAYLSKQQKRLWIIDQIEPDSTQYNLSRALKFDGELNQNALQQALSAVVERHQVLRTTYHADDQEQAIQVIRRAVELPLPVIDVSHLAGEEQNREVSRLIEAEVSRRFDLTSDLMLRVLLVKLSSRSHVLNVTMHHIASDGWSGGVLTKELSALYGAFSKGLENPLPPLAIQYADYSHWQREWLQGEVLKTQLEYWAGRLQNLPTVHGLPLDRMRPAIPSYRGGVVNQLLGADMWQGLNALAQSNGATLFMVLNAAFACLLSRYSGERDIVIGSPIVNREQAELAPLVGFFVNTLILRSDLSDDPGFIDLLAQSKARLFEAYEHQQLPFESLVDELQPARSLSHNPLFQIMLILQNNDRGEFKLPGLTLGKIEQPGVIAKFDLTLEIMEKGAAGLELKWEYAADLFDASTIEMMAEHFEVLLKGIIANPAAKASRLPLLTGTEKHRLLVEWNDTAADYPRDRCAHELFEEQVTQNPDAVALVFENQRLTYGQLNEQANRLAHYLVTAKQVGPDTRVGICMERSLEMVVAILGVLKAGGAYVPLDPEYPEQRIQYMLEDAELGTILTQRHVRVKLAINDERTVCLEDETFQQQLAKHKTTNLSLEQLGLTSHHLAYVIYTSGSTGNPKGVMVEHHSLVNRINWMDRQYGSSPTDRILQKTPFSFDVSVWEFVWPLTTGAAIVLAKPDGHKDPLYLSELIQDQEITKLHFVPSMLSGMLALGSLPACSSLRQVFCSGEALSLKQVEEFYTQCSCAQLHNLYGPTEAAIDVSYWDCGRLNKALGSVPIGKPIQNIQLYVLDQHSDLSPQGIPGELHIGGVGLARGYLNRPDLTRERFIPNPFYDKEDTNGSERLYKTGDLVRWLPDGNLEFLGRIDHQVKIRGFRIELGEIEHALLSQTEIKDAVVLARESATGDKQLVAYVVPQSLSGGEGLAIDHERLRRELGKTLPDYMVPSFFVELHELPLTPNGKVDRKALPEVNVSERQSTYIAPRTQTERMLCEIWQEVLGVERVGVQDNFFRLGGHSLSATRLAARINEAFQVAMPLKTLFKVQSLEGLAQEMAQLDKGLNRPALLRVSRNQVLPPSYGQQRLWLLDRIDGGSAHYNVPGALRLKGLLDVAALNRAFSSIVERHESLRTCFAMGNDGQPVQAIRVAEPFVIPVTDLSALTEAERQPRVVQLTREEAGREFDLSSDLMMRGRLLKLGEADHILLVTLHHIASDGWSISILINEFSALYGAYAEGRENPLEPLAIQYADYAHWQRNWLRGEVLEEQIGYWVERLAGIPVVHSLPLDHPRPSVQTFAGKSHWSRLDPEVTQSLRELCQKQGATLFMGLHAVFSTLLSRYSNETDIVVGSPIANREQAEVAGLIGFFVNNLVLRSDLSGSPSFKDVLNQSKAILLDAYAHQQVPFEQIVERLQPPRSLSHGPLFQLMLILQNNETGVLELPGLTVSPVKQGGAIAKYDLTLSVDESDAGLYLNWEYATDLFDAATIERMAEHFEVLLNGAVENPDIKVSKLPLLREGEKYRLMTEWNSTALDYPCEKCIHELFEAQAIKNPDALAVVFKNQQMSYAELNRRANRLAHCLVERGVRPDTLVGLYVERSLEMVIGLLGILKAGGAYLPLDPGYPEARLKYMLEDSAVGFLVMHKSLCKALPLTDQRVVYLDDRERLKDYSPDNLDKGTLGLRPDHLSYVIYTSGSTGNAKGVMIEHRGLTNFLASMSLRPGLTADDTLLAVTSLSFDIHVLELYLPLITGAKAIVASQADTVSPDELAALIDEHQVSVMQATPATWQMLIDNGWDPRFPIKALCGGEALSSSLKNDLLSRSKVELWNMYGPTETTVWSSVRRIQPDQRVISIGGGIANTRFYVFSDHLQLVPIGVAGELHIGGAGLARGYLNRPGLTAEKFIQNPLSEARADRLYKTGDLVRWLPDGSLEFLGRIDHQVKIRGFRVELAEIETALRSHGLVKNAVAVASKDERGTSRLLAYITVGDAVAYPEEGIEAALKQYLGNILPKYMVPSVIVLLDSIPLTPNGKVNRKALPAPDSARSESRRIPPRTEKERKLARVFSRLLGIAEDSIGINDSFFELGGDSLMVVRLASLYKQSGMDFSVKQVYIHPTIAELAELKGGSSNEPENHISGEVPLLLAQTWFLKQNFANANRWNVIANFDVHRPLDVEVLRESVNRVMAHHEALRARFSNREGKWTAEIRAFDGNAPFIFLDLSGRTFPDGKDAHFLGLLNEWDNSLSFTEGPLIRVSYIHYGENPVGRLSIVVHHMAVDGYSMKIVLEDLFEFYRQLSSCSTLNFPARTASVRRIAEWITGSDDIKAIGSDLKKWFSMLPWDQIPAIPRDLGDANTRNNWGSSRAVTRSLGKARTRALQDLAKQTVMSIEDFLLLALANSITSWTGYNYMQVTVIDAGRDLLSRVAGFDVTRSVGWISVARLLILHRVTGSANERIRAMKEQLARMPHNGLLMGDYDPFAGDPEKRLISDEIKFDFGGIVESDADNAGESEKLFTWRPDFWSQIPNEESDRAVLLQCKFHILQGDLVVRLEYSMNLHLPSTAERLASQFIRELEVLLPD